MYSHGFPTPARGISGLLLPAGSMLEGLAGKPCDPSKGYFCVGGSSCSNDIYGLFDVFSESLTNFAII